MCLKQKKIFDDEICYLHDKFFVSNPNFTAKHVKIVKNTRFFFKISKIPGFFG